MVFVVVLVAQPLAQDADVLAEVERTARPDARHETSRLAGCRLVDLRHRLCTDVARRERVGVARMVVAETRCPVKNRLGRRSALATMSFAVPAPSGSQVKPTV